MSGEIPSELGSLSSLKRLHLDYNQLSGELPAELLDLPSLRIMTLWGNRLSAEVSSHASERTVLSSFYSATGGADWSDVEKWGSTEPVFTWYGIGIDGNGHVTALYLADNQLSGEIPSELGSLSNLSLLSLWDNELSGEIPSELGSLSNLETLHLDENQLTGEIPSELGNLSNLNSLYLSENQLSGEIPSELGNLSELSQLYLAGNQLSGCVPSELRDVQYNDLDDLGLPFCDATPTPEPSPTPGPSPEPTATPEPTPTSTPEPTPTPEPPADECVGTVSGDGAITGSWSSDCDSEDRSGSYASYYTFTLTESADVTITVESSVDTYLYLREGAGRDGTVVDGSSPRTWCKSASS